MPAAISRRFVRWMIDHMIWDPSNRLREGFWAALWATRRLSVVVAASALLTWGEWVEHHPPAIAVIALLHFIFVFAAFALLVSFGEWFSRGKRPRGARPGEHQR